MTGALARQTVAAPVRVEGAGLFTGTRCAVTIGPVPHGTGVVFTRDGVRFPASIETLSSTPAHPAFAQMPPRNTGIERDGVVVHTVEHILAALAGLGITDAAVAVEGDEVPIGDGSSSLFTEPILDAGARRLDGEPAEPIRVRETIRVERGDASITIEPSDRIDFVYRLDYGAGSPIPRGEAAWDGAAETFVRTIAPARTFCLQAEAEAMHAMGLFEHLTPRDMLVFGADGPIENELRFPDEPARHKLLDLIGDLALAGRPILGRVTAEKSGHALTHEAVRRLLGAAGGSER